MDEHGQVGNRCNCGCPWMPYNLKVIETLKEGKKTILEASPDELKRIMHKAIVEMRGCLKMTYDMMCWDSKVVDRVTRDQLNEIWRMVHAEIARGLRIETSI